MGKERLIVIGGDAAGMTAASQARGGRNDLELVAFVKGNYVSYAACGIPYYVGGLSDGLPELVIRTPEQFGAKQDIQVRIRQEVVAIRPDEARVVVRNLETAQEYEEPYDNLIITTGAKPVRPDLPGVEAKGIYTVSTLDDAQALRQLMENERPARVVIVGGGYIGVELTETFHRWDVDVSLVARAPSLMRSLDPDMGDKVAEALSGMGIHLYPGEAATGFEETKGRVTAVTTTQRTLPADLVIVATGVTPNSDLAREAGLPLGIKGAIKVDDHMRTPAAGIWAAGDCVETVQLATGRPYWTSLATIASKQGRVAGTNLTGGDVAFPGTFGTTITKAGPVEISHTGVSETDLQDTGIEFAVGKAEAHTATRYYPTVQPMTVKLIAEVGSGRLLGGQIVGGAGAAMRINVLATALQAGMTVDDVATLDLAYAPPFSMVWDPILLAARDLCSKC